MTEYNTKQRAKYGQNYIKDPSLVRRMLALTNVTDADTVLEIGPGHGAFTAEILRLGANLVSIEVDGENVDILKRKFSEELKSKQLEVVHKDALEFESRWCKTEIKDGEYKIVASIPYSISSQLFKKFLLKRPMPSMAWFTVQKEFALRAMGKSEYGLLSVLINSFYIPEIVHEFDKEDFSPVPSVDSVFLQLKKRDDVHELLTINFGQYKDFVRDGFTQPIKTVQKHFKTLIPENKLQQLSDKYKFKLKDRTTDLSATQWQALFVVSLA
jgi:ribosomal RNA small subunit methyltransferase A